jgi:hypothetical protein
MDGLVTNPSPRDGTQESGSVNDWGISPEGYLISVTALARGLLAPWCCLIVRVLVLLRFQILLAVFVLGFALLVLCHPLNLAR